MGGKRAGAERKMCQQEGGGEEQSDEDERRRPWVKEARLEKDSHAR
jgi:hypothetical protein